MTLTITPLNTKAMKKAMIAYGVKPLRVRMYNNRLETIQVVVRREDMTATEAIFASFGIKSFDGVNPPRKPVNTSGRVGDYGSLIRVGE